MTRVNLVPVSELFDQHLMAEYREAPMVSSSLRRSLKAVGGDSTKLRIPAAFTLNAGHVSFFYDKGLWLFKRYEKVVDELKKRSYGLNTNRITDWPAFEERLWNDWTPNERDIELSRQRIEERVAMKPSWYRKTVVG